MDAILHCWMTSARPIHAGTALNDCADLVTSQMPFVKKVKSGAYFSRFQVKYRRRREGKTDCEHLRLLLRFLKF